MDKVLEAAKELVKELNRTGGHYERLDQCIRALEASITDAEAEVSAAEVEKTDTDTNTDTSGLN